MDKTTFWQLLTENRIEIPIIQRDYAQGRESKEYLRQTFLESLKKALDENKVLKLDFVYGSTENNALQPLDGQQRLTTLWLLHWYIAMRAGKLNEGGETLKKFTYETRISSREFCGKLCNAENFESFDGNNIASYITSQTWFYSSWKQDPTIQSMIRMLGGTQIQDKAGNDISDGIEEVFGKETHFIDYWEKLKSDNAPIVFYYLPLKDFGLSDDLYIKMNARGKQLTSFENFKADLVGYINKQAEEEKNERWKNLASSDIGISKKLDTEWTDIFWQNKTGDGKIDEIYFAFLNRYFLHYAIANLEANENSAIWKLYGNESNDSALSYDKGFQMYADVIDKSENKDTQQENPQIETSQEKDSPKRNLLERLSALFDNLNQIIKDESGYNISSINSKIRNYLPVWFSQFDFIPQYNKNKNGEYEIIKDGFGNNLYKVTTLTRPQRVVFFGICRYWEECGSFDKVQFKRWMRVVCNLTENNTISDTDAMRSRIKLINELSSHCTDIYGFLSDDKSEIKSDAAKEQLAEEIEKAKQILKVNYNGNIDELKDKTWEDVIIEAENFAFFKGAIRFLFCNGERKLDWENFDQKWQNAQKYFDKEEGLYKKNSNLLRLFISQFDNAYMFWKLVYDNADSSWRKFLTNKEWEMPIHKLLCSDGVKSDYSDYVSGFGNEDWKNIQEDLVKTDLLEHIEPGCLLYWKHHNYLLAPSGAKADWKKYIIANKRNKILSKLYGGGFDDQPKQPEKIYTNQKISGCDFFWGLDIRFRFTKDGKDYIFQWQKWNWVDIYDGNDRLCDKYKVGNENENNNNFTIDGSKIVEGEFINKLEELIQNFRNKQKEIQSTVQKII